MPAGHWLCDQAYELVGSECEHAEHAVAHHLRGATDPDMATAELVLEAAIDALTRRTLVIANLLGKLEAEILPAPGFGSQFLRQRLVAAGVGVNQRDVAECAAVLPDRFRVVGGVHQVIQIGRPRGRQRRQRNGGLAVVQRGGRQQGRVDDWRGGGRRRG